MRQAQNNFVDSLRKIRNLVTHIAANTTSAMGNPLVLEMSETQQCATVVLLTGCFETFLKDVIRSFIAGLSSSSSDFTDLHASIRSTHFTSGGKVLTEVSKSSGSARFSGVSKEDVVRRLYSPCHSTRAKTYVILWEAFADTKANPNTDVVKQIGKSLGLDNVWTKIAINSKTSHSDSTLISTLDDLVRVRNACAHTGSVTPIPGTGKLLDYVDCLSWIAEGFVSTLEIELSNY